MAGIYIHIPFCRSKCHYCNFFSLATSKFRNEFYDALLKEIDLTHDYLGNEPMETLYFGGGTPSLFTVRQLEEIIERIRDARYGITPPPAPPQKGKGLSGIRHPASEITLELNPDDVTPAYLKGLTTAGFNRLSLGVQSFFDTDLQYLGRQHDARQAEKALSMILDAGWQMPDERRRTKDEGRGKREEEKKSEIGNRRSEIETISIDLIYGIPTLTSTRWKENLRRVIDLGVPHISAYALTVEPKTALAWQLRNPASGIREPVSDDQAAEHFEILMESMEQAGYIHYEISNFCLPGFESKHNSNYWKGIPYLGLGPSAHSFNRTSRRWNIANLTAYIREIESGKLPAEEEILTITQQYNEYVMTSLRTIWGADIQEICLRFGPAFETLFRQQAIRHLASGHLSESGGIFTLSRKGKFLADGIAADLFWGE